MKTSTLVRTRPILLATALSCTAASPAAAFFCYLPSKPEAPYPLRDKPDAKAKILTMMPAGGMVKAVSRVKERGGFAYVEWIPDQTSQKVARKGWVNVLEIHGGECAD